jgi:hypothetical protein
MKIKLKVSETEPNYKLLKDPNYRFGENYVRIGVETKDRFRTYNIPKNKSTLEAYLRLSDETLGKVESSVAYSPDYKYKIRSIQLHQNKNFTKITREALDELLETSPDSD